MQLFTEPIITRKKFSDVVVQPENTFVNPQILGGTCTGTSFKSVTGSARFDILPNNESTVGLRLTNSEGDNVFLAEIDGTNTGDVTIGNYADDNGILWDDSEGIFNVKGNIIVTGDIESSNYVLGVSGYKLEYATGYGYFNNIVVNGGTIGGQTVANVGYVATTGADTVPASLACSSTGTTSATDGTQSAYVILTWTAISSNTFDHYLIRYKKASYTYYTYLEARTNTITIEGLVPNISYNFGIASVNKYGTSSAFSSDISQTTASDTTAPETVTAGSATAGIQYVIVEWTHNTETDLASYNIYRSETNDTETAVLIGNSRTNYFVDGGRTGGTTYYYWIKAIDTSGNVSEDFSTVKSATPRNVTSDDIVTIAGSKVLIDGEVYLSNWRSSSDLTKIDGGNIYTGSVTTTQLNFTPVQSTDVIAKINASEEGITIDADNISISGSTTFSSGYDPTDKVAELGGSYSSSASGARVLIFPDATNTGLQVIDDAANNVFECLVGGDDVGDVTIGDWAGNQGIKYDKSEGTTTFKGNITGVNGTFGTITAGTLDGVSAYIQNLRYKRWTVSHCLSTLDGWETSVSSGASLTTYASNIIALSAPSGADRVVYMECGSFGIELGSVNSNPITFSKSPTIEWTAKFNAVASGGAVLRMGSVSTDVSPYVGFAFDISGGNHRVRGTYRNTSSYSSATLQIGGVDVRSDYWHRYRIIVTPNASNFDLNYYIDDTLVLTYSNIDFSTGQPGKNFGARASNFWASETSDSSTLVIASTLFQQDY